MHAGQWSVFPTAGRRVGASSGKSAIYLAHISAGRAQTCAPLAACFWRWGTTATRGNGAVIFVILSIFSVLAAAGLSVVGAAGGDTAKFVAWPSLARTHML